MFNDWIAQAEDWEIEYLLNILVEKRGDCDHLPEEESSGDEQGAHVEIFNGDDEDYQDLSSVSVHIGSMENDSDISNYGTLDNGKCFASLEAHFKK